MIRLINIVAILSLLMGCSDSDKILISHDFNEGNWLLVNVNYVDKTLRIIDDEVILQINKDGIWVTQSGDCSGTTCDGFLKLYKDGKLIAQDEYLTHLALEESSEIKRSYKKGIEWTIDLKNNNEFKHIWDSLLNVGDYPTVYHTQPADKDIIWAYKIKNN